jgi:hypothetical protein
MHKHACRATLGIPGKDRFFVKVLERDPEDQYLKDRTLHELSVREGSFRAALPLGCLPEASLIAYEPIEGLLPLSHALAPRLQRTSHPDPALEHLFYRLGAVLAAWHGVEIPSTPRFVPDFMFDDTHTRLPELNARIEQAPQGVLFWDYTLANVALRDGDLDLPVVFDAAPPRAFPGVRPLSLGPLAVDLGWFLNGLFKPSVPFRYVAMWDWSFASTLGDAFLNGYERRSGARVDRFLAWGLAARLLSDGFTRRRRGGPPAWALRRAAARHGMALAVTRARESLKVS